MECFRIGGFFNIQLQYSATRIKKTANIVELQITTTYLYLKKKLLYIFEKKNEHPASGHIYMKKRSLLQHQRRAFCGPMCVQNMKRQKKTNTNNTKDEYQQKKRIPTIPKTFTLVKIQI